MWVVVILGILVISQSTAIMVPTSCCVLPTVDAACWLSRTKSDVEALQAAVNCAVATRIVVGSEHLRWILSDTLHLNTSNQELVLEHGVLLEAERGAFHATDSVLVAIQNVENVTLSGDGAILKMWKDDYSNPTQ